VGKPIQTKLSRYVALALFAPSLAFGAGLGKLTVLSGLGQPLNAEIEVVSLQPGERESLQARLASLDAFRQANIEFSSALAGVQTVVERRPNGRTFVRLTSGQPVNEPFLDMLVELSWASGKLVREYTFLLDPVEYKGPQAITAPSVVAAAPAAEAPAPAPAPTPAQPATAPRVTETAPAPVAAQPITQAPAPESAAPAAVAPAQARATARVASGTHEVKRGDSLAKIAAANLPAGVTLQQMLTALYRANEGAFINKNMNLLRTGRTLTIPDAETVRSLPTGEARQVVAAHTREWNEYKAKLAAAVAAAPAGAQGEAGPQVSGRITPKVEDKPSAGPSDELRLSRADAGQAGAAARTSRQDDIAARDKALREANERVGELEKNVQELQKLVELKNEQLAAMQRQAQAAKPAEAPRAPAEPPKAVEPTPAPQAEAAKPAEPAKAAEAPAPVAPTAPAAMEQAKPAESKPAESKPAEAAPAAPVAEKAPEAPKAVEAAKPAAPAQAPEAAAAKPKAAPPAPEPSFLDTLTENPLIPAGALAILAAIGGGLWWRRKRSAKLESSLLSPATTDSSSVFGSSGGRSIDTGSALQTDFSQSGIGAIDTDEVDPVAEADVYMAYGRDAQAEEILKEALQKDPTRQAVRLKLLEIYAARKDVKAFETTAAELYAATGGQGADWEKAAALGRQMDPANTMFSGQGVGVSGAFAAGAAAVAAGVAAAEGAAAAAVAKPAQPMPSIDFDLDAGAAVAPKPDLELDTTASGRESAMDLGLDLDLGTSDTEVASDFTAKGTLIMDAATKQALADAEQARPDLGLSIDFELPDPKKAGPAPAASVPEFDIDVGEPPRPAPSQQPADLSGISLDLGGQAPAGATPTDARWQEVATKLDLAKAYEEMGDKDGARELLGEVLTEGDVVQQQQAKSMLDALK
jgi:pilus assembly protein FimV